MPTRIKTRTNSRRARDPIRIINHDATQPYIFSMERIAHYDEIMREREKKRHEGRTTRKVRTKAGRNAPYLVRSQRVGGARFEKNDRYPLKEIIAAKKAGRRMKPQTKAEHW